MYFLKFLKNGKKKLPWKRPKSDKRERQHFEFLGGKMSYLV